jgi:hypothetical protein
MPRGVAGRQRYSAEARASFGNRLEIAGGDGLTFWLAI